MAIEGIGAATFAVVMVAGSAMCEPALATWDDLRQGRAESCRVFLDDYLSHPDCAQQTLMSRLLSKRFAECSPGNVALDGRELRIAGFVHPLEFQFNGVQEFLLIPRIQRDCRHPPPPLPDQVLFVSFPDGIDVTADPVWVTGVLQVRRSDNEIASASYVMRASTIEPAAIPDVTLGE